MQTIPSSVGFLDLPPSTRTRIYELAGTVRYCVICVIEEWRRRPAPYPCGRSGPSLGLYGDDSCYCDFIPIGLMLSCRSVYNEMMPILYGRNRFTLTSWFPRGCKLFQQLSPTATTSLRFLEVETGTSGDEIRALLDWISTQCDSSKLSLTFECKIRSQEEAEIIYRHFTFLGLKECAVNLGHPPQIGLDRFATSIAWKALGYNPVPRNPFPFMKLPAEIRRLVLRHACPIARCDDPYFDGIDIVCEVGRAFVDYCPNDRSPCCQKCSPMDFVCCCRIRKSEKGSRASYSITCCCFTVPTSLFLVSKDFSGIVRDRFFADNRFRLWGTPMGRLEFLRAQPAQLLRQIRTLDICLEKGEASKAAASDEYSHGPSTWIRLIDFIATNLDIANLHLSIDAGIDYSDYSDSQFTEDMLEYEGVLQEYHVIMEPFARLRGLRKFFVFLSAFSRYEARFERDVMGPDYNSTIEGKTPHRWRSYLYPHKPTNHNVDDGYMWIPRSSSWTWSMNSDIPSAPP